MTSLMLFHLAVWLISCIWIYQMRGVSYTNLVFISHSFKGRFFSQTIKSTLSIPEKYTHLTWPIFITKDPSTPIMSEQFITTT